MPFAGVLQIASVKGTLLGPEAIGDSPHRGVQQPVVYASSIANLEC